MLQLISGLSLTLFINGKDHGHLWVEYDLHSLSERWSNIKYHLDTNFTFSSVQGHLVKFSGVCTDPTYVDEGLAMVLLGRSKWCTL